MTLKILKPLTVLIFLSLIAVFVAYRTGVINNPISSSPNGGDITLTKENPKDSAAIKRRMMMSSSKSAIMTDFVFDTSKIQAIPDTVVLKNFQIMGSSKSALIIDSRPFWDSLGIQHRRQLWDSIKVQQK